MNEYNVLKIYKNFNIYAALIIGIMEIANYKSLGEASGMPLTMSRESILLILILQVVSIFIVYPLFLRTKDLKMCFAEKVDLHFIVDKRRIHIVTFAIILAELIFSVRTGNGIVGREATSNFSALFNLIKVSPWMMIYYVAARDEKNRLYWLNIVLYILYEFILGWSGQILSVTMLELFLRGKHNEAGIILKTFIRFRTMATVAAFAVGSFFYRFIYALKFSIRLNVPVGSIPPLSMARGAEELMSRFTNFPITVSAVQNHSVIAHLYQSQHRNLWEVESIFSPLLPRFIMPNKEYRPLSNIVKWAIWEDQPKGTGTGYNFFVYWFNIFECDLGCFLLGTTVFLVFVVLSKKIIYMFDDDSKDVEVLYFMFLLSLFTETALGGNFGYGYISLVYTIPVIMLFGGIKLKRHLVRDVRTAGVGKVFC